MSPRSHCRFSAPPSATISLSNSLPAWSPDGRYLAFFRFNEKEQSLSVYITASLGGSERRLYTVHSSRKVDALDWSRTANISPSATSAPRAGFQDFSLITRPLEVGR